MSGNTHVPDKLEGYLLQVRHALFELISVDDCVVSVEGYDDVAVENEDVVVAEQTKSVLSDNNPLANRSIAFWKTLYNWCDYVKNNAFPNKKLVFKYVVISTHTVKIGDIPKSFAKAATTEDAKKALEIARKEWFGDGADDKKKQIGEKIRKYIEYCFASENESTVLAVISLMAIDVHEDTYDESLKEKFRNQIIPQEYADELFYAMLGWVTEQVHQQTKENKPAYISASHYRDALTTQIRGKDLSRIFSSVSVRPEDDKTNAEIERHDTYIRQLELIDADATKMFEAASDFLRTKAEKTEMAKKGLVAETSFTDYYDGLKRMWGGLKLSVDAFPMMDERQKGSWLYGQCTSMAHTHRLQGNDVPSFFGSGSLQTIANEPPEHPEIGWHPRYIELLGGDEKNEEQD